MQLHVSSFSVGESIQGSTRTYRDNVHKFIVYIKLILSFIKSLLKMSGCSRVHMPDNLPDAGRNITGACDVIFT